MPEGGGNEPNISKQVPGFNSYLVSHEDYRTFMATVIPSIGKFPRRTEYWVHTDWAELIYIDERKRIVLSKETLGAVIYWMDKSSLSNQVESEHRETLKLCSELKKERKSQSKSLNEILGIST
jgi:hypothetical protein